MSRSARAEVRYDAFSSRAARSSRPIRPSGPTCCASDGKIVGDRREVRRARRARDRRRGRPVRHAGRHRSAHAHAAAVHGHGVERRLLHRHRRGPRRRHDDDHRLRDPQSEAAHPGRAPAVARMGEEIRRPTTPSTSPSPGGTRACARTWARWCASTASTASSISWRTRTPSCATTKRW